MGKTMMLEPSDKLTQFLMRYEAFRPVAYNDANGNATKGYGHLLHRGRVNAADRAMDPWTEEHARRVLSDDIGIAAAGLGLALVADVAQRLIQQQVDALVSLVFNIGITKARESTLLRELNSGGFDVAPVELMRWIDPGKPHSLGLVNRRRAEAYMWLRGVYDPLS